MSTALADLEAELVKRIRREMVKKGLAERGAAKEVFAQMDKSGSGYLARGELTSALRRLGYTQGLAAREWDMLLQRFDSRGCGEVSFEAFVETLGLAPSDMGVAGKAFGIGSGRHRVGRGLSSPDRLLAAVEAVEEVDAGRGDALGPWQAGDSKAAASATGTKPPVVPPELRLAAVRGATASRPRHGRSSRPISAASSRLASRSGTRAGSHGGDRTVSTKFSSTGPSAMLRSFADVARRLRKATGSGGISSMRRVFRGVDVNGSGQLSASELESAVTSMGFTPQPGDIVTLLRRMDANADSSVSWEEFAGAVFGAGALEDAQAEADEPSEGTGDERSGAASMDGWASSAGGQGRDAPKAEDDASWSLLRRCAEACGRRAVRLGHSASPLPLQSSEQLCRALTATLRGANRQSGGSAIERTPLLEALRRDGLSTKGGATDAAVWNALREASHEEASDSSGHVALDCESLGKVLAVALRAGRGLGGDGSAADAAAGAGTQAEAGGHRGDGRDLLGSLPASVRQAVERAAAGTLAHAVESVRGAMQAGAEEGSGPEACSMAGVSSGLRRCGHDLSERDAGALEAYFDAGREPASVDTRRLGDAIEAARQGIATGVGGGATSLTPGQSALLQAALVNHEVAAVVRENQVLRAAVSKLDSGFLHEVEELRRSHGLLLRQHAATSSALHAVTAGAAGEPLVDAADALSLDGEDDDQLAGSGAALDRQPLGGLAGLEAVSGLVRGTREAADPRASALTDDLQLSPKLEAGLSALRTLMGSRGAGRFASGASTAASGFVPRQAGTATRYTGHAIPVSGTAKGGEAVVLAGRGNDAASQSLTEVAVGNALRRVRVPVGARIGNSGEDVAAVLRGSWDAIARSSDPGVYGTDGRGWRWASQRQARGSDGASRRGFRLPAAALRGSYDLAAPALQEVERQAREGALLAVLHPGATATHAVQLPAPAALPGARGVGSSGSGWLAASAAPIGSFVSSLLRPPRHTTQTQQQQPNVPRHVPKADEAGAVASPVHVASPNIPDIPVVAPPMPHRSGDGQTTVTPRPEVIVEEHSESTFKAQDANAGCGDIVPPGLKLSNPLSLASSPPQPRAPLQRVPLPQRRHEADCARSPSRQMAAARLLAAGEHESRIRAPNLWSVQDVQECSASLYEAATGRPMPVVTLLDARTALPSDSPRQPGGTLLDQEAVEALEEAHRLVEAVEAPDLGHASVAEAAEPLLIPALRNYGTATTLSGSHLRLRQRLQAGLQSASNGASAQGTALAILSTALPTASASTLLPVREAARVLAPFLPAAGAAGADGDALDLAECIGSRGNLVSRGPSGMLTVDIVALARWIGGASGSSPLEESASVTSGPSPALEPSTKDVDLLSRRCRDALVQLVEDTSKVRVTMFERLVDIRAGFDFLNVRDGRGFSPQDLHGQLRSLGALTTGPETVPPSAYVTTSAVGLPSPLRLEVLVVKRLFAEVYGAHKLEAAMRAQAAASKRHQSRSEAVTADESGNLLVWEEDWGMEKRPAIAFHQFARWAMPLSPKLQDVRELLKARLRSASRVGGGLTEPDRVFRQLDKDGSGKISLAEFRAVLGASTLAGLTPAEMGLLVQTFDMDGDGEIDMHELVGLMADST